MSVNRFDIQSALRDQLLTASGVSSSIIAWEGRRFDTTGIDLYVRESLQLNEEQLNATRLLTTLGLYVLDIMHPATAEPDQPGIKEALDLADAVKDVFEPPRGLNNLVQVYRAEVAGRNTFGDGTGWAFYPVTVYWRAFEQTL
jgi:hypothetical protein